MKKLIEKFNTSKTILVVSGYPVFSGGKERNHGMAWYTKRAVENLAVNQGRKVVVLAENGMGRKIERHYGGKVLVLRVFGRGKLTTYPVILKWLKVFGEIDKVYVHSEFGATGGLKHIFLLPLFLGMIRLSGRKIVYFAHNVVADIATIAPQLNLPVVPGLGWVMNKLLAVYYWLISWEVEKVVVLEEAIRQRLSRFIKSEKLVLAPLRVELKKREPYREARKKLKVNGNEFVVVSFGFVSWYKGSDWLVENFSKLTGNDGRRKLRLVLAGGEAHSLKNSGYYKEFYRKISRKVASDRQMSLSGYVPEKEIATYMSAADLVIFPYRGLMGASGSLSMALGYQKPVIVSKEMEAVFSRKEMRLAMKKSGLKEVELVFDLSLESLEGILGQVRKKNVLEKLGRFSKEYGRLRGSKEFLDREYEVVYSDKEADNFEKQRRLQYAMVGSQAK